MEKQSHQIVPPIRSALRISERKCQETSFAAITLNLESNFTPREEESFSVPLKHTDVSKDVKQENASVITGSRGLPDLLASFTQFALVAEKSLDRRVVWREIDKKAANIQARSSMARALEVNGKTCQAEGKAKVVEGQAPSQKRMSAREKLETSVARVVDPTNEKMRVFQKFGESSRMWMGEQ